MSAAEFFARDHLADVISFKTQYQLALQAEDDEIVVDDFCGGGGGSSGLEAGLQKQVWLARNHNASAISMHQANHPHTLHLRTDVFNGDPRELVQGLRVGWYHLSPDCTHHSQAKGGQPRKKEIRNLAWIAHKWAGRVRPRIISLENVEQLLDWGGLIAKRDKATGRVIKLETYFKKGKEKTRQAVAGVGEVVPVERQYLVPDPKQKGRIWAQFVDQLRAMGYVVEWRVLRACDFGAPTIRKRLFMIARCDGLPIHWPSPTHFENPESWQKPWRTAAECIDWANLGASIFGRKKPLVPATLRRIAKGIDRYVLGHANPFIVPIANWSAETVQSVMEPLRTITAWPKGGSFAVASPVLAPLTHQGSDRINDPCKPLPTVTAANRGELAMFTAMLCQANGGKNTTPAHDMRRPVSTITVAGTQQQLVQTELVANYCGLSPEQEAGALRVASFLMHFYSTGGQWGAADRPINTITTRDRIALVSVVLHGRTYVIVDIKMRMLTPRELYRAQGFPDDYVIDKGHDGKPLTRTEQVRMCGNSVSPPILAAIAAANDWRYPVKPRRAA
ncbi:DNA cytosine methyltransferase [Metapseudomonas otitidis]|uniref:DNA cytosine methyltransferase n=1 Tax=Metapseudomonas otitidis TaxID=319939 RepID=UPI000D19FB9E|nr:DNA cytosine methyltransferase [Pseudomonas otitidis]